MAMRHPRTIVLAGAFAALALMSLLSAMLGHILPSLLPRRYTTVAAAVLFFVFGAVMLKEGLDMDAGNEKIQEEMREVQKEVEDAEEKVGAHSPVSARRLEDAEEGAATYPPSADSGNGHRLLTRGESSKTQHSFKEGIVNLVQLFVNPILLQTFVMTFLAEWGDRSQISTIALAAAHVRPSQVTVNPVPY
jgi:putative Ca2+/H+ antiporter (TMEM165/GDT1 family)